jgi:teichuronic acid biosynthesis glycosyltransferase TuaG
LSDISVIIAAYEAAGTIDRALRSIAAQSLKPSEVVVVDDGSTDGTASAAGACANEMNGIRLRVFRGEQNLGAGAARNRAIEESTGPTLAFLDADDEWMPEKLERSMAHLEDANLVLVAHDYLTGPGPDAPRTHCGRRFRDSPDPFTGLYRKGYISTSTVVTRRAAVLTAGGFDPGLRNAQDFDLWLAMLRQPGTAFLVFDEPLMRYHISPGSIMSHTGRRLRCGIAIAERFFPDLKARPGSALMDLWFRVAALHMEAFNAYMSRRDFVRSLICGGALPVRLMAATVVCLVRPPSPRGHFLETPTATKPEKA